MTTARLSKPKKVIVGLSGGVDSAMAASRLKNAGYDVTGVMMIVYDGPALPSKGNACYGCRKEDDIAAAKELAALIGIPFQVFNCAEQYRRMVLDYFRSEYLSGKTPNPCVRCNHMMKFGVLPQAAAAAGLEFDYFATGHYARVEFLPKLNRWVLKRGLDFKKDQSYFLYRLNQEQLARALFPLGELTKEEVRGLAAENGLPVHDKPDSQDFYSGDYSDLLKTEPKEGKVVDAQGRELGRHQGFWRFTPGQRKGLGVSAPLPLYVLKVNADKNEVVVGSADENRRYSCLINDLQFIIEPPDEGAQLQARVRSSQALQKIILSSKNERGELTVNFAAAQTGLAPGQSLVLYQDDLVVGGGIILSE